MRTRIEQLEALSRLRENGALTDGEFAAEKAHLLAQDNVDVEDAPANRPRWLVPAIGGGTLAAVGAAAWFGFGLGVVPDQPVTPHPRAITATPSPTPTPSASPTPQPVALDEALSFSSPPQCIAGDTLAKVYTKLDAAMEGKSQTVTLDAFPDPLPAVGKSGKDADGATTADASIRFPPATYWHALRLSRVTASRYQPPESDSSYTRQLVFLDPPDKLLRALNRLGFQAVAQPGYSELPDTYNSCGGAMEVVAVPGGSALRCGWGC